ncbi:MAG: hypothetical protein IPO77_22690 [Acidobacteria bacterium]|nr:hypothetical protein [Acidobacteriota bacterium]
MADDHAQERFEAVIVIENGSVPLVTVGDSAQETVHTLRRLNTMGCRNLYEQYILQDE